MIIISQIILQLIFINFLFQNFDKSNYSEKIPNVDLSIDMIFIRGGEYTMGNKKSNLNTQISSFWMSKYEITWDIYQLFVDESFENTDLIIKTKNRRPSKIGCVSITSSFCNRHFENSVIF